MILITSNRGLCGAYNAQAIKKALALIKQENNNAEIHLVTIGKKGDVAMRRIGQNVLANFFEMGDSVSTALITPISKLVVDEYNLLNYDKVLVVYTDFISALTQKPNIKQLLPISKSDFKDFMKDLPNNKLQRKTDYLFEGNRDDLISTLAEKLTRMQIYQMILESNASEQSSRMVAMKNASDASGEMIDDLTLVFNKARQANITREISEISAGMTSVS